MTSITGTLYEDQYTFLIVTCPVILGVRNVSDKSCRVYQSTHFVFNDVPPHPENHAVYEIMLKYIVEPDSPQMTIWRMRVACWIPRATNTHSE